MNSSRGPACGCRATALAVAATLGGSMLLSGCSTAPRSPEFAYDADSGCGALIATTRNRSSTEVLYIEVNQVRLGITQNTTTALDLTQRREGVRVEIEMYQSDKHNWRCGDVLRPDAQKPRIWTATGGRLSVEVCATNTGSVEYPVTVELIEARFKDADGRVVNAPRPIRFSATVGTGPGG